MQKLPFIILSVILFTVVSCKQGSKKSTASDGFTNDSTRIFYNDLFSVAQNEYLYKNKVNWDSVIRETKQELAKYNSFEESLKEIEKFFDRIDCDHCNLIYKGRSYFPSVDHTVSAMSKEVERRIIAGPSFEVKVLDNKYGYILIPGMHYNSTDIETLTSVAKLMYNKVYDIKSKNKLKGWIVDLRLNPGGTAYPMILSLYDFLGTTTLFKYMDADMNIIGNNKVVKGKYYDMPGVVASIEPKGKLLKEAKVAILIGAGTASAGEITALSFKCRPNTLFVGSKTAGLTTINSEIILPYNGSLAFTTAYDADKNGKYYRVIEPDVVIEGQDNYDNLMKDGNVLEAIKFINKK